MINDQDVAIDTVFEKLGRLTPDQLRARLDKYKNSDVSVALRELSEFSDFLQQKNKTPVKIKPIEWETQPRRNNVEQVHVGVIGESTQLLLLKFTIVERDRTGECFLGLLTNIDVTAESSYESLGHYENLEAAKQAATDYTTNSIQAMFIQDAS